MSRLKTKIWGKTNLCKSTDDIYDILYLFYIITYFSLSGHNKHYKLEFK